MSFGLPKLNEDAAWFGVRKRDSRFCDYLTFCKVIEFSLICRSKTCEICKIKSLPLFDITVVHEMYRALTCQLFFTIPGSKITKRWGKFNRVSPLTLSFCNDEEKLACDSVYRELVLVYRKAVMKFVSLAFEQIY